MTGDTSRPDRSAAYAAPDRRIRICRGAEDGVGAEYVRDRQVTRSIFGLSDDDRVGTGTDASGESGSAFPLVTVGAKGRVRILYWSNGYWFQASGRVQADYAGIFADVCPDLPAPET